MQKTAFAFMRVNTRKLTRIQVHDRIRTRNERYKLIADECCSVCDNYIPRVTRTKLIKLRDH